MEAKPMSEERLAEIENTEHRLNCRGLQFASYEQLMVVDLLTEVRRLRAETHAPMESQPTGGDDYASYCLGCGDERDDPHTWRECAERLGALHKATVDALCDSQMREQKLREQLAEFRDLAKKAALPIVQRDLMPIVTHKDLILKRLAALHKEPTDGR